MKKVKKVAAIICVVLLAGLYIATLIFSIFDKSTGMAFLKASLYSTVMIPAMLYVFIMVTRLIKNSANKNNGIQAPDNTDDDSHTAS